MMAGWAVLQTHSLKPLTELQCEFRGGGPMVHQADVLAPTQCRAEASTTDKYTPGGTGAF